MSSPWKVKTLLEKGAPLFDFRRMTRRAGILLGTHFILGGKLILVPTLSRDFHFDF